MARIPEPKKDEPIRYVGDTKRYGPRYRCVLRVGPDKKQMTRTFGTLKDARAWVTETRAADNAGRLLMPSRRTLRQVSNEWLARREATVGSETGIREVTLNGYRSSLSSALMHLGETPIQDVTVGDLRGLLTTLSKVGGTRKAPLSHRSLVYTLGTLRQVLQYAVEEKYISDNPARSVKPPAKKASDRKRAEVWSPSDMVNFRDYIDAYATGVTFESEPWVRVGMRLTLCGLRRSEVLGLDWDQVDLATGTVRVEKSRVKTGRSNTTVLDVAKSDDSHRIVPSESVHPGTNAALRDLWMAQGQPKRGPVIVDSNGIPVHPDAYSRKFQTLRRASGVGPLTSIHNIRHTIATTLHDRGVEPRKVASLLGHKVTTHLAFYVPTSDAGAAEAASAAGDAFSSAQPA